MGKAHFYKNIAKSPIHPQNLLDFAPYFGAYFPEIWGRIVHILIKMDLTSRLAFCLFVPTPIQIVILRFIWKSVGCDIFI